MERMAGGKTKSSAFYFSYLWNVSIRKLKIMKILQILVKNLAQGSKEESAKQSFPTKIKIRGISPQSFASLSQF
jgi:hypothetical protein